MSHLKSYKQKPKKRITLQFNKQGITYTITQFKYVNWQVAKYKDGKLETTYHFDTYTDAALYLMGTLTLDVQGLQCDEEVDARVDL